MAATRITPPGSLANHLRRANVVITPSVAFDASYPISAISDLRTDLAGKFGSLTTNPTLTLDKQQLLNANLNAWSGGLPTSWTVSTSGTGAVAETTVAAEVVSGSAAKCTSGTGFAAIIQTVTVQPGDIVRLEGQMRGDGTNNAQVQVINLQTGKYLTSGLAWSAANSVAAQRSAATYAVTTLDFTVENYLACDGHDTVQLQIVLISTTGAGIAYFDDWTFWPVTTFTSVHGHNIDPLVVVEWRDSVDNFGASDVLVATMSLQRPSFYSVASSLKRYQRLKFVGTQSARSGAIWLGEWWIGQSIALQRNQHYGYVSSLVFPQDRMSSRAGRKISLPLSEYERRAADLQFTYNTLAMYQEARDQIFRRSLGGHHPVVLVLDDTDAEDVRFGYVSEAWPVTRTFLFTWDAGFRHEEEPFPIMAA